ncbi:polyketide cyclase/dehydrase/lipid transport protein [Saccharothrix carnea]|uniref:Polyketide cyclase/dehydrase/lipid transport protein n=1 Tax=Saccharothrix carnea TaxID=1280637 RepID=A0A2P8IFW8_SACCR|nr:SRPBCC family protein [Saccharothrix carnea]PSL57361.1 polyketide cyclase/dehydrase/lipid transport protein [Saccharothrix carnea]
MSSAERTTSIPADADVVFDVVTDLENLSAWLPSGVEVERYGPNLVRLWSGENNVVRHVVVDWDKLTIDWGSPNAPTYVGNLQVLRTAPGLSAVAVRLTGPEGLPTQRLENWLARALEALATAVSAERRATPHAVAVSRS